MVVILVAIPFCIRTSQDGINPVAILSAFITLYSSLLIGMILHFERKRDNYDQYKSEVNKKIEKLEEENRKIIEKELSEMKNNIFDEMRGKLNLKFEKQISLLKEDYDEYREELLRKVGQTTEPIEIRQVAAETVRWQAWHKIYPSLSDALKNNKREDFLSVWNDFHEFNLVLASLLSPKQEEIFDGLGRFVDRIPKNMLPDELWNLILTLNKQKRFKTAGVFGMLDRLGEKMGKSQNEVLLSSQENED